MNVVCVRVFLKGGENLKKIQHTVKTKSAPQQWFDRQAYETIYNGCERRHRKAGGKLTGLFSL